MAVDYKDVPFPGECLIYGSSSLICIAKSVEVSTGYRHYKKNSACENNATVLLFTYCIRHVSYRLLAVLYSGGMEVRQ